MQTRAQTESIKLLATTLNALAILLIAASLFGNWIDPNAGVDVEAPIMC